MRQAAARTVGHRQALARWPARHMGQQLQLQVSPSPGVVFKGTHLLDKRRDLPVNFKALEADVQQGRWRQVIQMNAAHQSMGRIGQLSCVLKSVLVKCRPRAAQTPQQCSAALPLQRPLMGMLPGPLAVMQQGRFECTGPVGMSNPPLL